MVWFTVAMLLCRDISEICLVANFFLYSFLGACDQGMTSDFSNVPSETAFVPSKIDLFIRK
jgi:hypothetical protein